MTEGIRPDYLTDMNVLLIEDEASISGFIKKGLEENGYEVMQAFDGDIGLHLASRNQYDVIILDLILPGVNGLEICKRLRQKVQVDSRILMLTALNETDDLVKGFDAGADDYLGKPFKFRELLARVNSLARSRGRKANPINQLAVADLILDLDLKTAIRAGQQIKLTAKEFYLLQYLIQNKNRVVNRMEILENVWNVHFDLGTNVVDVYMAYLRKKIDKPFGQKLIHTVVGMGYLLKAS
ncbi:MAG: response regulator transcription factor [Bacteroidota bacterium]